MVSLVPSITETLHDLGCGASLVGVTDYCIFPEQARERATPVGGTKTPDVDLVRSLQPDLVHVNLEENLKRHAQLIEDFAPVFASEPRSVSDVVELIGALGRIHGAADGARRWATLIETEQSSAPPPPFTFLCPIWKDPWMWCGGDTYVSGLVTARGGANLLAQERRYPKLSLDEALETDPDVIFLPDEPFLFTDADRGELAARTRSRIVGPFPGHLFTWHGTRTLQGLRFLNGETLSRRGRT